MRPSAANPQTAESSNDDKHPAPDAARGSGGRENAPLTVRQQVGMLATILLLLDVLVILANIVHLSVNDPDEPHHEVFSNRPWNGDFDGSHAEVLGHVQLIGGAVILLFLAVRRWAFVYGAWAIALLALTVDDLFMVHERVGVVLAESAALPEIAGLRPRDLGELAVWAAEGLIVGLVVIIAAVRASPAGRRDSVRLFLLALILVFFGVVVDQLHIVIEPFVPAAVAVGITLVETAGELLGMTLLVLAAHSMAVRPRPAPTTPADTAGAAR